MSWPRKPGRRPLILGHRGASHAVTENTIEAFLRAIEDGADGVELDARLCASGEVVVFHDDTLERLAGIQRRVDALDWAELREVRLAGDKTIPLLADVLERVPGWVNVEIKAPPRFEVAAWSRAVADVIDGCEASSRVLVTSFHPGVVAWFKARRPRVDVGLLFHAGQAGWQRGGLLARVLRVAALHPHHVLVGERAMREWRARGYAVGAWTVDDPKRALRLARLGVTAIITNEPAAVAAVFGHCGQ